jgi:hypothetical protein
LALYLLSLAIPALGNCNSPSGSAGLWLLLVGWLGLLSRQIGWLANAFLLVSLYFSLTRKGRGAAVVASVLALLCAANAFTAKIPDIEGVGVRTCRYSGFWLWQGAMVLGFLAACFYSPKDEHRAGPD